MNKITAEQMRAMAQSLSLPATYRSPFYGIDKICRDASIMLCALATEREQSPAMDHVTLPTDWRREGMVVAVESDTGKFLGCMGRNKWEALLSPAVNHAAMVEKLRELSKWCHDDLCGDVAYKINAILDAEPAEPME